MNKKQVLDAYLKTHDIPKLIVQKININSFLTDNFAYMALRIGNSIGDNLDISIEIIMLEEIAKKYNLVINTTEHAELHSKGISENDLDNLLKGAVLFENITHNKELYKQSLKEISDFIRTKINEFITT
jgi:hypothetical protein